MSVVEREQTQIEGPLVTVEVREMTTREHAAELLRRAKRILSGSWIVGHEKLQTRGGFYNYCSVGALKQAYVELKEETGITPGISRLAYKSLSQALPPVIDEGKPTQRIIQYNDGYAESEAHVRAMFDQAIENLRK